MFRIKKMEVLGAAVVLLLLCWMTYGDLLTHQFMDDDHVYIKPAAIIYAFYHHFGDFFIKPFDQHYAPLHYWINVELFGLFQKPAPLYLINLMFFYVECLLLFVFIYIISSEFIVALLTSVIFLIHPMTGEVLQHITRSSIIAQNILLEIGFISLYLYSKHNKNCLYYYLSLLMVFLALFCQELALLFPLYAAALLFFLTDLELKRIIKVLVPFILLDILFIILWFLVANSRAHLESIDIFHPSLFWSTIANFSHICFWYLSNLFFPRSIVYMCNILPLNGFIWFWNSLFIGLLTGLGLLIFLYFKKSLESFALVLFLSGFIYAFIASQVWLNSGGWMFDPTWLFLPSLGFFLFIVLVILKIKKHIKKWLYTILLSVIFISYFLSTCNNNVIARTEVGYCEHWLRKFPGAIIAMNLLADSYRNNKSIPIPSDIVSDMLHMVDLYIKYDRPQMALELIQRISASKISISQRNELSHKLATYYCKSGHDDQCWDAIGHIIGFKKDPYAYLQLSNELYLIEDNKTAINLLKQSIKLYPKYKESYLLMGVILANGGQYKESIYFWQQGLAIDPRDQRFIENIDEAKNLLSRSSH